MPHDQIDGKLLRAFTTTLFWKHHRGTWLIANPNGKKVKDWIIRSHVPNLVMIRVWEGFNDLMIVGLRELITPNEGLR